MEKYKGEFTGDVFESLLTQQELPHLLYSEIDMMTKAELEQGTAELVDWFFPFCIAGLSVLGVFGLFLLGWRHTPW